jgi:flagellar biogenesis protein FliO
MPPGQVILFIIGTVAILFGAYYVTYYIGLKASGQSRTGFKNRNINLLDRFSVARDKSFCIIEIAGKIYVVGITNHTMTLLDTFDAAAFTSLTEDNRDTGVTAWNMTPVGQYGNKLTKKLVAFIAAKTGKIPPGGFSPSADSEAANDFAASLEEAERNADNLTSSTALERQPQRSISRNVPPSREAEKSDSPEGDSCP